MAERDRIEEERRRRDAGRPLHQGQRIQAGGRRGVLVSALPATPLAMCAGRRRPSAASRRRRRRRGRPPKRRRRVAPDWARDSSDREMAAEIARAAAYGELPRDGRRTAASGRLVVVSRRASGRVGGASRREAALS